MQYATFAIDKKPYCVWDRQLDALEGMFLDRIDPSYFEYVVKRHAADLDGDNRMLAALALRTAYSHAQETLMSLLCALVQAPSCVVGWLHKYHTTDLVQVVDDLHHGRPVLSGLKVPDKSWEGLSNLVHGQLLDKSKEQQIKEGYGRFWRSIASDFLEREGRDEYNSIKHGLRVHSGGFHFAMGKARPPGTPAPPEQMMTLGGSDFGTTYFTPEPQFDKHNIGMTWAFRNWLPDDLGLRVQLMAYSMGNVLSFLKLLKGGDPKQARFSYPDVMDDFNICWRSTGVTQAKFKQMVGIKDIQPLTKQQIKDRIGQ